jgi:Cdc6-like AAA superfamily ATPase
MMHLSHFNQFLSITTDSLVPVWFHSSSNGKIIVNDEFERMWREVYWPTYNEHSRICFKGIKNDKELRTDDFGSRF